MPAASRLLNKAEQNYDVTNHESLAVVWTLRYFRELILGYMIHVYTDHYAVTEIFQGTNLTGKFAHWQLTVQEFNPTILYIAGKANLVADTLSRNVALVLALVDNPVMPSLDVIKNFQRSDTFCSGIIYYLDSGDASNLPQLHVHADTFFLQQDRLYKSSEVITDGSSERLSQLVNPMSLVDVILYHIHDSPLAGHPGRDRSFRQPQRSYFWQSMRKDIFQHCSLCHKRAAHRSSPVRESPSRPYPIASSPWDAISVDLLKLPLTENGHQYLLVCVDSFFSRFTVLSALKDKSAKSVGRAIIDDIICR